MNRLLLLALIILTFSCNNLEDANLSDRKTFIRFYGGTNSQIGKVAEADGDGFIILGDSTSNIGGASSILLIKVNEMGLLQWQNSFPKGSGNGLKTVSDGYIIAGDGIEVNATSEEISEIVNTEAWVFKTDMSGNLQTSSQFKKSSTVQVSRGLETITLHVDYHASGVTVNGSEIVVLGSYKVPSEPERILVTGFASSVSTSSTWERTYNLFNYDYQNCRSIYSKSNQLIWASTADPQSASSSPYLTVTTVPSNTASPSNYGFLSETDRAYKVNDLQPSGTGFVAVGSYSDRDGKSSNAFVVSIDPAGNVLQETVKFFDGEDIKLDDKTSSTSEDSGDAVAFTRDGGFVIALSMNQTPTKGNGGKDIILIKADVFGNVLWDRLYGGAGDETVSSIRELSDGSLLICGTATISNTSSIFLMKTDKNGELKD
jgi:hypothetical protein